MSCKYTPIEFCHKRSVSFVKVSQLTKVPPPAVPIPAFTDITNWTIDSTVKTPAGVVVLAMTSDGATPEIVINDSVNNIITTTIPDDVMITFPLGRLRFDYLFYDDTGLQRATKTAYFNIEEEITVPRVLS